VDGVPDDVVGEAVAPPLQPLQPGGARDLLADFFRLYDPARLPRVEELAAGADASAGGPASLFAQLEAEYDAPDFFSSTAFNFRSRFFDPLAALYEPGVLPPVPAVRPLDNLTKAAVLLPASDPGSKRYVQLGVLHDEETRRKDEARRGGRRP
jgi:hypothetical protein